MRGCVGGVSGQEDPQTTPPDPGSLEKGVQPHRGGVTPKIPPLHLKKAGDGSHQLLQRLLLLLAQCYGTLGGSRGGRMCVQNKGLLPPNHFGVALPEGYGKTCSVFNRPRNIPTANELDSWG